MINILYFWSANIQLLFFYGKKIESFFKKHFKILDTLPEIPAGY
jgi:hypothetical protein